MLDSYGPIAVGTNVIVRTLSFTYTGRLSYIDPLVIALEDAAWIAESGRWADVLESCDFDEVEPYPGLCVINRGPITDVSPIARLPRVQK